MTFLTVFVADPSVVKLWAPLPFLLTAGALHFGSLWASRRSPPGWTGPLRGWGLRLAAAAALAGGLLAAITAWGEYRLCSTPIDSGEVSVVTGPVTDFKPMPARGHATEQFVVDGVRFGFSGFSDSCSFHHAAAFGGPLREGLVVRVYHKRGRILRLDIAEP